MRPTYALAAISLILLAGCAQRRVGERQVSEAATPVTAAPIVIAHRGASAHRPEHTLAAYELAIEQGADFIEPDLVPTRDGVLIARHENELSGTTDVAARAEFAARRTLKQIDGERIEGWFSEDFTLAEIKTLRARERIPAQRPGNTRYDGAFEIPTLVEIIALVRAAEARGRRVGIYPETKHPTYFAREGRHLDGSPIARSLGTMLIDTLIAERFTDPARIYIQSFEIENLLELAQKVMPRRGVRFPLVQLFGDLGNAGLDPASAFAAPYDLRWHLAAGSVLAPIYGELALQLPGGLTPSTGYRELAAPVVLVWMRDTYAAGIGPWISNLLPRMATGPVAGISMRRTGAPPHSLLADARAAGLAVHPYTLRPEPAFRAVDSAGKPISLEAEAIELLQLGATGYFADAPDLGVAARDRFLAPDRP
jgi:glycerophosphoryl diester phosphodiesterase